MGDDLKVEVNEASSSRQYRDILKLSVNERFEYFDSTPKNDIALIVVATPFVLSNTFRPVNVTNAVAVENESCRTGKLRIRKQLHHVQFAELNRLLFSI